MRGKGTKKFFHLCHFFLFFLLIFVILPSEEIFQGQAIGYFEKMSHLCTVYE